MRKAWIAVYILVFVVLFLVGFLQTGITVFDSDFLDQVRYFRVFFTSPLPFLLSVLISRIDFSPREQKDN